MGLSLPRIVIRSAEATGGLVWSRLFSSGFLRRVECLMV